MPLIRNDRLSVPNFHQGFTLIEVMVAVLVLAIGLLGLAGLQATAVRSNDSALMRSQATILAYDMSDRMRANRQAALGALYDLCSTNVDSAGCTGTAKTDLQEWSAALARGLPFGAGRITRGAGNAFTITVLWNDNQGQETFSVMTEL